MDNSITSQELMALAAASESPAVDVEVMTPAITRMVERGASPEAVAALLGISAGQVRRVVITTRSTFFNDDELADNMRHLMTLAYGRAVEVMQFGPQSEQAALTRLFLAYALKSISGESTSQFDEIRAELDKVFNTMRRQDADYGSGTGPSFVDAEYPNEGFDD